MGRYFSAGLLLDMHDFLLYWTISFLASSLFLTRSIILQLPQSNFPWPLCQHGALWISLVLPLVLLLLYLACSFPSCFCISFISVQITGKTYKRSLNSCPSLGKQKWLSLWRVAHLGPFGPMWIQSLCVSSKPETFLWFLFLWRVKHLILCVHDLIATWQLQTTHALIILSLFGLFDLFHPSLQLLCSLY